MLFAILISIIILLLLLFVLLLLLLFIRVKNNTIYTRLAVSFPGQPG